MPDLSKMPAFGDGGWFWLSAEGQTFAETMAKQSGSVSTEIADAYRAVFSTPQGQLILRDLEARTVRQPTWVPELPNPEQNGYAREGQNSMYRYIEAQISASLRREALAATTQEGMTK